MPPALADVEGMVEKKAALGIDLTIVGSPVGFGTMVPVPGLDPYSQPLDQLKSFHDWLAETVEAHAVGWPPTRTPTRSAAPSCSSRRRRRFARGRSSG